MKTDWIFDGIEAWINEGNGRMAKIGGESTVAHFARKVRATDMGRSLGHDLVNFFARAWPPLFSSPSLCKQSELQCCASCLASLPILIFFLIINTLPQGFTKSRPYQCKYLPARSAKTKIQNEAPKQKFETNKALQRTKKAPRPTSRGAFFIEILHYFPVSVAGRQECGD